MSPIKCITCKEKKGIEGFLSCKSRCAECERTRFRNYNDNINRKWSRLKHRAKEKNIELTLNINDFIKINENPCFYCGDDLKNTKGIGLDRVDSNKGYALDNVVKCCSTCNTIKMDFNVEFLLTHLPKMLKSLSKL